GPVVERAERVARGLDVAHRQRLVDLEGRDPRSRAPQALQVGVILGALADGLLEDGRVRGHAADAVLVDQPLQLAALDQLARDEVEPDGLSEAGELLEGIHEDDSQAGDVDRGPERGTAPRMHSVPSSVQPSTGARSTRASSPPTCAGDTKRRE